ncbi:hypothetical protein [Isoptericola croceus]|uniref:hypothetical protein n=1 Tax=Isoptericola croceus TaxID=3031406 RepID=UPI0023F88189|nr:hypothetical protein [Isoptericola croceus]
MICDDVTRALRHAYIEDAQDLRSLSMAVSATGGNRGVGPTIDQELVEVRARAQSLALALGDAARIAEQVELTESVPEASSVVGWRDLDDALQRIDVAIVNLRSVC